MLMKNLYNTFENSKKYKTIILEMQNVLKVYNGKRKLYALKDKKLMHKTKGHIELELCVIYNPVCCK